LLQGSAPFLLDGPFEIPANTVKTFHLKSKKFDEDQSLLGFGPHAHLLCQSWLIYMVTDVNDTVPLIYIPKWDFNWQGGYMLTKIIKIPKNSSIYATVVYDNTSNNPNNPNDPPKDVHNGPKRTNEMAQVHFWLMDYQQGDEEIVLDSAFYFNTSYGNSLSKAQSEMKIFPNPAAEIITVNHEFGLADNHQINIYNAIGKSMTADAMVMHKRNNEIQVDCSRLLPGVYFLELKSSFKVARSKFIIEK
jgi:hypothetical protein